MILSDGTIHSLIVADKIQISPLEVKNIESASIDLRLGSKFLFPKRGSIISFDKPVEHETMVHGEGTEIFIPSQSFVLATTLEKIKLPSDITAFVEGRSSIGRLGLFIQNAGWVDPGFEGQITLELFNASPSPMRLDPFRRICQLVLCQLDKPAVNPYNGKYQGQVDTTGSRISHDREVEND